MSDHGEGSSSSTQSVNRLQGERNLCSDESDNGRNHLDLDSGNTAILRKQSGNLWKAVDMKTEHVAETSNVYLETDESHRLTPDSMSKKENRKVQQMVKSMTEENSATGADIQNSDKSMKIENVNDKTAAQISSKTDETEGNAESSGKTVLKPDGVITKDVNVAEPMRQREATVIDEKVKKAASTKKTELKSVEEAESKDPKERDDKREEKTVLAHQPMTDVGVTGDIEKKPVSHQTKKIEGPNVAAKKVVPDNVAKRHKEVKAYNPCQHCIKAKQRFWVNRPEPHRYYFCLHLSWAQATQKCTSAKIFDCERLHSQAEAELLALETKEPGNAQHATNVDLTMEPVVAVPEVSTGFAQTSRQRVTADVGKPRGQPSTTHVGEPSSQTVTVRVAKLSTPPAAVDKPVAVKEVEEPIPTKSQLCMHCLHARTTLWKAADLPPVTEYSTEVSMSRMKAFGRCNGLNPERCQKLHAITQRAIEALSKQRQAVEEQHAGTSGATAPVLDDLRGQHVESNIETRDIHVPVQGERGALEQTQGKSRNTTPDYNIDFEEEPVGRFVAGESDDNWRCSHCKNFSKKERERLECEKCFEGFHFECVGIKTVYDREEFDRQPGSWLCKKCVFDQKRETRSRACKNTSVNMEQGKEENKMDMTLDTTAATSKPTAPSSKKKTAPVAKTGNSVKKSGCGRQMRKTDEKDDDKWYCALCKKWTYEGCFSCLGRCEGWFHYRCAGFMNENDYKARKASFLCGNCQKDTEWWHCVKCKVWSKDECMKCPNAKDEWIHFKCAGFKDEAALRSYEQKNGPWRCPICQSGNQHVAQKSAVVPKKNKHYVCAPCGKSAQYNSTECGQCREWVHIKCAGFTKVAEIPKPWWCRACTKKAGAAENAAWKEKAKLIVIYPYAKGSKSEASSSRSSSSHEGTSATSSTTPTRKRQAAVSTDESGIKTRKTT